MRQIDIAGMFNTRSHGDPAWLVRSGSPEGLSPAGAEALREIGVSVVVDLREPDEAGEAVHGLPVRRVAVYGRPAPETGRLEDVYDGLLRERGAALAEAVGAIADASGAALVHCTAGKDRTGLVVALALAASGVGADEIEADYSRSGAHVRPEREGVARGLAERAAPAERAEILRLHLDSPVAAIAHALDTIDEHGGAEAYLRGHGLTAERLAALRAKSRGALEPAGASA